MKDIFFKNYERYLGRKGFRKLVLRITAKGITQEELSLLQTWARTIDGIESLVIVEPGSPLAGTRVRIRETMNAIDLSVEVDIPGSSRMFSVRSPFETFVFGSEFTYEDFRFFLPPGVTEPSVGCESRCCCIVSYCNAYARHVIDPAFAIPMTTEWYDGGNSQPFRLVLAKDFQGVSGVVMPSKMIAERKDSTCNEQSCMILRDVGIEQ